MKRRYAVSFTVYANHVVEVEADSEEEAREKAMDEYEPVCLCHHCAEKVDMGDDGDISAVTLLD